MRIDAKRPTAGSNQRRTSGLGAAFRGGFATRGPSAGADGSGAPSRRGKLVVLALALAVLTTALLAATALSKEAIIKFGGSGGKGGQFSSPREIAVNRSGAGPADAGDLYVVERDGHRVQRFDSEGNFISAWGADVALPDGGTNYEICTEASGCQAGAPSGGNGTAAGNGALNTPQGIAVDEDTGNVYVSDRDNRRINAYDGVGNFLFSVGRDVAEPNGATVVEVCDGGTETCRMGDGGSGPGEIGSTTEDRTLGLAVSPPDGVAATGTIYLADSQNRRVNTYALDGTSPASFGSAANFATLQPRKVAVDSRGIVYASDSQNSAEIERYDSEDANGGGVGFLAPIVASLNETQTITFSGGFSGQFTLSCPTGGGTATILHNFQAAFFDDNIRSGLKEDCETEDVEVITPGPDPSSSATLIFAGDLEATDVPQTVCTPLGAGSCPVTTVNDGSAAALLPGHHAVSPTRAATATADLAVDPDSDGAGPDEDALHVARKRVDSVGGVSEVQQFGLLNDPGLTAAPGEDDERHGGGAGLTSLEGLDLDDASGRLFAVNGSEVFVLSDPLPDPVPLMDPVTIKTDSTATFSGTVDPKGGQVGCALEYSTDQNSWTDVPASDCGSLSLGGGPQPVSEEVTGLNPNTAYFVRLHVFRALDSGAPTATSSATTFKTVAPPPVVTDVGAIQVQDTSARLAGTIDPRNNETGYVFEYGTTPALGTSTTPLGIGSGTEEVTVSQVVGGLEADTTYYLRLVATNLSGTTNGAISTFHTRSIPLPPANPGNCPNAALRAEQGSTHLPDCRAYEQVSPVDKNQGGVSSHGSSVTGLDGFSRDGNAAGFCATSLFGEGRMTEVCAPYVSRRGAKGWLTESPTPPICHYDPVDGGIPDAPAANLSPNFERAVIERVPETDSCQTPPLDPAAPTPSSNVYLADYASNPPDYTLLAPNPGPGAPASNNRAGQFFGGDDDFSHVFYVSNVNQTPPPDSPPPGNFEKLYEYAEGQLRLASVDPVGDPFTGPSNIVYTPIAIGERTISADGERIYFQNEADSTNASTCQASAACRLYLREGAAQTLEVSASECTAACGANASGELFQYATPDGAIAFFSSADKLTDDAPTAGLKLYRWQRNAPEGNRLTLLNPDSEPTDGSAPAYLIDEGRNYLLGASDDGEVAYFVNEGQLLAGEPSGQLFESAPPTNSGEEKIFRWSWSGGSPELAYLGPFNEDFGPNNGLLWATYMNNINANVDRTRVTPDGRYLVIVTRFPLVAAADSDIDADLFRWGVDEGWVCVSCQLPGEPTAGPPSSKQTGFRPGVSLGYVGGQESQAMISDDGRRIFFDTPDALVAEDTDGEVGCEPLLDAPGRLVSFTCSDVYEWNDGTLSLITDGQSNQSSYLVGATRDAQSAFFITPDPLIGHDVDFADDIYVARVNGGFPEPSPQPPECEGEGCREGGTETPGIAGAGSAVFQGPGNPDAQTQGHSCPAGKLRRGKRCLSVMAIARKRCRHLQGQAKRRCVGKQTRRLRRANARRANLDRRATR